MSFQESDDWNVDNARGRGVAMIAIQRSKSIGDPVGLVRQIEEAAKVGGGVATGFLFAVAMSAAGGVERTPDHDPRL